MKSGMESKMSLPVVVIGVDIGKEVFHLVGFAADGKITCAGGSGDWGSKMLSRSCRRASSQWKPA